MNMRDTITNGKTAFIVPLKTSNTHSYNSFAIYIQNQSGEVELLREFKKPYSLPYFTSKKGERFFQINYSKSSARHFIFLMLTDINKSIDIYFLDGDSDYKYNFQKEND